MSENTIDEITFDDVEPSTQPAPADPRALLPPELRQAASHLPPEKAYTVLQLKEEGSGHNASLLSVAATCYKMGVSYDDTLDHLQSAYSADRLDYETAPKRAVQRVWQASGDLTKLVDSDAEAAPDAREEMLLRFHRTPTTALVEASPGRLATKCIDVLGALFKGDDVLNIQVTALEFGTLVRLDELPAFMKASGRLLEEFKFLNPSTFKNPDGVPNPLKGGKVSKRCNENVKTRDWMVLEMDSKDESSLERFNTFAMTMAQFAPLVMAVDTGNKSTHFWFDASGCKPAIRRAFFGLACLHGADKQLAVKSQIARMPNVPSAAPGRGPQKLLYFDPDRLKAAKGWDLPGFESYIQKNRQLEYYYNGANKSFLTRDNFESWVTLDRTSLRSHLMEKGYRGQAAEGETIAPLDLVINSIQLDRNIEAVLPGASGRHAGLYEENGYRVIVKKSPTFIKARRGDWDTIGRFLEGLLGHEADQLEIFFGWLSDSVRKLRNDGKRRAIWGPCQMLHIIGPPNSGKTLLLKDILAKCFANRIADASPLFKRFPDMHNADTFGCELLFLDDSPVLETNYAFRQEFGERIKNFVVGVGGGLRDMQQSRINMRPWWRFVRLMNMEPATLATLPPLDEGLEDKLILLRVQSMDKGPLAAEMTLPGWYDRIEARVANELPAFIHFLLEEFSLPDHLRDPGQRFPVASYKSQELISEIAQGSPEEYLAHRMDTDGVSMFQQMQFGDDLDDIPLELVPWHGSAEQLFDHLAQVGQRSSQQRFLKTCPNPRVLLSQLRQIEKHNPARVRYSKRLEGWPDKQHGREYWVVFPPEKLPPMATVSQELGELF